MAQEYQNMPRNSFSRRLATLNSLQPPVADMQEAGLTPLSLQQP